MACGCNKPTKIAGICGKAGSGKTTAAEIMRAKYKVVLYEFARPLKQIARIMGFEEWEINGTEQQKQEINEYWEVSGREWLQKTGTEIFRQQLPKTFPNSPFATGIWINLMKKFTNRRDRCPTHNIIISDVRFVDEAKAIKDLGGWIIKIERNNSQTLPQFQQHASEREQEFIVPDFVIENNGTKEELAQKIDAIFTRLQIEKQVGKNSIII